MYNPPAATAAPETTTTSLESATPNTGEHDPDIIMPESPTDLTGDEDVEMTEVNPDPTAEVDTAIEALLSLYQHGSSQQSAGPGEEVTDIMEVDDPQ